MNICFLSCRPPPPRRFLPARSRHLSCAAATASASCRAFVFKTRLFLVRGSGCDVRVARALFSPPPSRCYSSSSSAEWRTVESGGDEEEEDNGLTERWETNTSPYHHCPTEFLVQLLRPARRWLVPQQVKASRNPLRGTIRNEWSRTIPNRPVRRLRNG